MKYLFIIIVSFLSVNLNAEIHREATYCNDTGELCFYWWPKLPTVDGWQQDKGNSYHYSSNTQAPIGFHFGNAESVIYAKAIYKLRQPESKNLEEFIANDKKNFLRNSPDLDIKETKSLKSKSGKLFKSFSFTPKAQGNWEQVSYSEEIDLEGNDYYLVFVLSSRSEQSYKDTLSDYEKFITNYE